MQPKYIEIISHMFKSTIIKNNLHNIINFQSYLKVKRHMQSQLVEIF